MQAGRHRRRVCPYPLVGGIHSLAGKGMGGSQFRQGYRYCCNLGIYELYAGGHLQADRQVDVKITQNTVLVLYVPKYRHLD